ncbi:MAG: tRNA (adenosine(37)-N6)-threonylcarbamoyltransferase complex transferase subunit TsaD [Bdellovibrionales bacterium]
MKILGIETSCDETAAAVIDGAKPPEQRIRSNLVLSQLEEHKAFGGVVPEIAARAHIDHLHPLITAALDDADTTLDDIDGIAATCGPGLIGGVMIGMIAAKALAAAKNKPFIAVNHLEGHALTPRLTGIDGKDVHFPYLLLLISGGHTQILVTEGVGRYKRWGTTLDDAAGECFDKSAKLMGLPHPGGPELQKIATICKNPAQAIEKYTLPTPMKGRKELDFSFSGLKTAIRLHIEQINGETLPRNDIADLAHAFQTTMAEIIADRCARAIDRFKTQYPSPTPHTLVVSGGVAANTAIRESLQTLCADKDARFYAPPLSLCGDNAAMIAWAGYERLNAAMTDTLDFKARPRWPLDPSAEPRHGAGVKA